MRIYETINRNNANKMEAMRRQQLAMDKQRSQMVNLMAKGRHKQRLQNKIAIAQQSSNNIELNK